MRSFFVRMFLLLVVCASAGCVANEYEGDVLNQYGHVGGYVRSNTTNVRIQMKNFLTGNWETVGQAQPSSEVAFWFTSYRLYNWGYNLTLPIASKFRSGNWIELRFLQGETLLMTFERTEHSEDLNSISPESCVVADYGGPNYDEGTDYYVDGAGDYRFLRQQPFIDCGLQTATGSNGVLRLRLN